MKSVIALTFLVLSVFCITWTEGTECYLCGHIDGFDGNLDSSFFDKSCKTGKKPKSKYKQACDDLFGPDWDSCGKLYFQGTPAGSGGNEVKVTARSCIPTLPDFDGKCGEFTVKDIIDNPTIPETIKEQLKNLQLPDTDSATICSCKGDNCNSSSMLQITHGLLMVSVAFLMSKFTGLI